ncbi:MAG: GDSL-type esterase/lipase family protein, partial [Deltaproteobacteria bacterium]
MKRKINTRRLIVNLCLIGLSTFIALALCEIGLRIAGYRYEGNQERMTFCRYDPVLGWSHRPGKEGRFETLGFSTRVKINRRGLRDIEHDYRKAKGTMRILVLGDSFVWGYGVEIDEALTRRMEASLKNCEVINAGVSGYSTDQELLWLEKEGVKYEPDLIILVLSHNDILANTENRVYGFYYKPTFLLGSTGSLELTNTPVPHFPVAIDRAYWLVRTSSLAYFLALRLTDVWAAMGSLWEPQSSRIDYAVRLTVALVSRMRDIARRHKARFLVAAYCQDFVPCRRVVDALRTDKFSLIDLSGAPGWSRKNMVIDSEGH